ncbi:MAG: hypothetical protein JNK87_24165 [Bryobacterales bacterium]|nr:hypothetical protein [Bryobacterales bacterium]
MKHRVIVWGADDMRRWERVGLTQGGELVYWLAPDVRGRVQGPGVRYDDLVAASKGHACCVIEIASNGELRWHSSDAKGAGLPRGLLVLDLAGSGNWVEPADSHVRLGPGEALLIPASSAQEKPLRQFWESLGGLPEDHRVAVLLSLIMPTYESRLTSLEATVKGVTPRSSGGSTRGSRKRWEWMALGGIALLVSFSLLFSVGAWRGTRQIAERLRSLDVAATTKDAGTPGADKGEEAVEGDSTPPEAAQPTPKATPKKEDKTKKIKKDQKKVEGAGGNKGTDENGTPGGKPDSNGQ